MISSDALPGCATPRLPCSQVKVTANQALTKVFQNDYEFKSRKPTLVKKYNYNNNLNIIPQYSPLLQATKTK